MELAISELPLAVFTTLGPLSAGAFVIIALLQARGVDAKCQGRLDRLAFIPLAIVVVGLMGAFAHLAGPLHAPYALVGVASSPLSQEILAALVFMVLALIYCVLATAGKLSPGVRKGLSIAVAVLGAVFSLFTGFAYWMPTIVSWAVPWTVIEPLAAFLLGAGTLGLLLAALAGCADEIRVVAGWLAVAGAVALVIALIGHIGFVSGIEGRMAFGSDLVASARVAQIASIAGAVAAAALSVIGSCRKRAAFWAASASIMAVVAVLFGRLVFYGLQISVGL